MDCRKVIYIKPTTDMSNPTVTLQLKHFNHDKHCCRVSTCKLFILKDVIYLAAILVLKEVAVSVVSSVSFHEFIGVKVSPNTLIAVVSSEKH
jgi:hypothetical protein